MEAMEAADTAQQPLSEPLTWAEICERYPDQQVCLVEVDRIHPHGFEFRTARVFAHAETRREIYERMKSIPSHYGLGDRRFTGQSRTPLIRPTLIIDDELRELLRPRR